MPLMRGAANLTSAMEVAADLRQRILRGELRPGTRLKIDDIAELCDVSHMPVRVALQSLEAEGVLDVYPHRGAVIKAVDAQVARLQTQPVDAATLERARVKMRSSLYDEIEGLFGFGRANLLATFALFDDDPTRINRIEDEFARVTPELVQRTAQEYLRPTNRTILTVVPKS